MDLGFAEEGLVESWRAEVVFGSASVGSGGERGGCRGGGEGWRGRPEPGGAFGDRERWVSLSQVFQPGGQPICTAVRGVCAVLRVFHARLKSLTNI